MTLSQTGLHIGTSDITAPAVEHVYILTDRLDGIETYRC